MVNKNCPKLATMIIKCSGHSTAGWLSVERVNMKCAGILACLLVISQTTTSSYDNVTAFCLAGSFTSCMHEANCTDNPDLSNGSCSIKLCSEVHLNHTFIITNRFSVRILGSPSQIVCSGNNSGIYISQTTDLIIQDVEIISCGFEYLPHKDHSVIFSSSIFIDNCTDVTIKELKVKDSKGSGLTMFDNNGLRTAALR